MATIKESIEKYSNLGKQRFIVIMYSDGNTIIQELPASRAEAVQWIKDDRRRARKDDRSRLVLTPIEDQFQNVHTFLKFKFSISDEEVRLVEKQE